MGKIVLLTLQATLVDAADSSATYRHYSTPSTKNQLPIREVKRFPEFAYACAADEQTRRFMRYGHLGDNDVLRFACDPAVEAVICGPTKEECRQLRTKLSRAHQGIEAWSRLPLWRKLGYWAKGIGVLRFCDNYRPG